MAPAEGARKGKKKGRDRKGFVESGSLEFPAPGRSGPGKGRLPFRIAPVAWGFLGLAFVMAVAFFFFLAPVDLDPVVPSGAIDAPSAKNRPAAAPLPSQAVVVPKEEAADRTGRRDEPEPQAAKPPGAGRSGNYAVQIRAFPEDQEQKAIAFLEKIREHYPAAVMETVAIAGHGVWHRILLGAFASAAEADEYRQSREVARNYPNSFVQKRSVAFRK